MTTFTNVQFAKSAFNAWAHGEKTGNYDDFKKLLSTDFTAFSHPLIGSFTQKQALEKMNDLIVEREINSNQLTFSKIQLINNKKTYVFLFDSIGKVSGEFPYKGFNAIVIAVEKSKLTSFKEYFGFTDQNWFK